MLPDAIKLASTNYVLHVDSGILALDYLHYRSQHLLIYKMTYAQLFFFQILFKESTYVATSNFTEQLY